MKTKLLFFLYLSFACHLISNAQTAEILFINNNSGSGAANLDLEVRVMPDDTVFTLFTGINYLSATTIVAIPASTILQFNYLVAGTSTVYFSQNNVVFNAGEFRFLFLYGTGTSKAYSTFTASQQSSSGSVIKYDFRHSTPTLQEIDLTIRETSEVLADNFVYTDMTSGFDDEFSAADYTLDLTPFDGGNGLFAYQLPGSSLGGEYILLFTAGTGSANDMYMAQTSGVVTQLTATTPVVGGVGINESPLAVTVFGLYPNPANDVLTINGPEEYGNSVLITIYDLSGQIVLNSSSRKIDVRNLESGMYSVQTEVDQILYYNKLIIAK